ncbi:MAG: histidinol-phosphatase [Pirellulales bacterium]|nr:histidinol-phosphatase [Pirellulales bacterium]
MAKLADMDTNQPTDPADIASRLEFARDIAREAGALTLRYFQNPGLAVERKADASPVTVADREAELLLRSRIEAQFPRDGILGEEFPERPGTSGFRWVLDPIDGTKSFIHGVPLYGTMVAVETGGAALLGVVFIPGLDELIYAGRGLGCWHIRQGQPATRCQVSRVARLAEGCFVTSEVKSYKKINRPEVYEHLQSAARLDRTWGDCYGYLLVATGRVEMAIDPLMNIWDAAAVQPIIEEAGGRFTDWAGTRSISSGNALATNGLVHDEALGLMRG